ncbi:MAG: helix-turn-helix transcriptional regulator [Candidatus Atribacteria bacterium]|nr:helix-turn-helix transcriptional regulator [Candidatus Atribacteria bacterium]
MPPTNKSAIGDNIKKYRNKLGVSQDRLSKLADVTYNTIIKIESGANTNPTIETLSKIAKALNVGVDDLIKETTK